MSLPERINVMRVMSYDVQQIIDDIIAANFVQPDEITIEDCLDWIEDWVADDFHYETSNLIYQDENGEEL